MIIRYIIFGVYNKIVHIARTSLVPRFPPPYARNLLPSEFPSFSLNEISGRIPAKTHLLASLHDAKESSSLRLIHNVTHRLTRRLRTQPFFGKLLLPRR